MAKQVAQKLDPEGDRNFNPRTKRSGSTRALSPEERRSPIPHATPLPSAVRESGDAISHTIEVPADAAGQRLDQFLTAHLDGVSRSRVQMLMEQGDVLVNCEREKASMKLRGGERIVVSGEPRPAPLKATAEDIPLDVVYEDGDLAVVNKPAGMMVHAGSGQNEDARSKGTLVNALLYRFKKLSSTGGDLRPGIVHRLDKDTSGLIVVAKNDHAHAEKCSPAARSGKRTLRWCRDRSSEAKEPSTPPLPAIRCAARA
jgi:ribosomal 50S subunit-recycling heat shock protein